MAFSTVAQKATVSVQRPVCGRRGTVGAVKAAQKLSASKCIGSVCLNTKTARASNCRRGIKELETRAEDEDPPPTMMVIAPFQSAINALLQRRIIRLGGEVNDAMANCIVAQLLYLDAKDPDKDIKIYVNSPGGSVTAGMAIFDTMRHVKADVSTICVGQACSMGAFLLAAGTKGKRYCMPNSRVMIHQPLGGARGQAADLEIQTKEMIHHKKTLTQYMAEFTGKSYDDCLADTDRDFFLGAQESVEYGLVDGVLSIPKWEAGAATVDMNMYNFDNFDWRELPTLDPSHPANKNLSEQE